MSDQATVQNMQQPQEAPTLVWDDSAMQTQYANVCNVMGTREEMALLFVPSESIYADLQEHFDDLVQRAHRARVVIVSPSLLALDK